MERDAHGNVQLSGTGALADLLTDYIKTNTNITRVRGDTFGYLQRSFLGCVSDVDQREAREVGEGGAVRPLRRPQRQPLRVGHHPSDRLLLGRLSLNPLEDIAAKTKVMPTSSSPRTTTTD